ncbi:hypothetical protein GCM10011611_02400 [Aliidongia dinghuensis]|uniref:Uncharacterized protein n=1 Tax=Aliidongia dinghuensis TaxID=1867774 RepID=A0A8J3E0B5_9PROT|nr:hypothetical protein GCM10011611_02400 [Aliidongia dinghuensis]
MKVGLVAFVDLLGFSARVEAMKTFEDLKLLDQTIARVQRYFDHKPSDSLTKESQQITAKTVLAFSDCLVITVPVDSELASQDGHFDVLMNELSNFALSLGLCAVNGIFLRGGVDFGLWYRNRDRLISPAMVKAYELERDACVPMIAVTGEVHRHFSEHRDRKFYHKSADPIPRILRRFDDLPNGKAQWLIDYMPICLESVDGHIAAADLARYKTSNPEIRDQMRNEAFWRDCRQWATWHADAIRGQYRTATAGSIRAKYVWLARYHDDAVARFFGTAPAELLIGDLANDAGTIAS